MTAVAIQRRGGSTAAHAAFTGLQREATVDTDTFSWVTHDGATLGGFRGGGYKLPLTGSVVRDIEGRLRDSVSLLDFIPKAEHAAIRAYTSTYDCSLATTTALATGAVVRAPLGKYCLGSAVTCSTNNAGLVGDGRGTIFVPTYSSGDVFTLGDGTAELSGWYAERFRIAPSGVMSGGIAFNCRKITDSEFRDVRVGSIDDYVANGAARLYHGYYFDRFSQCLVSGGEIVVLQDAVRCRGNSDQSFGAELRIGGEGMRIYKGACGIRLGGGAGGVHVGDVDISEATMGIVCDNTLQSGAWNRELFLHPGCTIDLTTQYGLNIEANGLVYLEAVGLWVSGCGTAGAYEGIRIAPKSVGGDQTIEAKFIGAQVKANKGHGLAISAGWLQVSGGDFQNNGSGAADKHGIFVAGGADISFAQIVGAAVFGNGHSGGTGYGIKLSSALTAVNVQGCTFFSNQQGPLSSDTTINNSTIVVRNNTGCVCESSGYATMLNGNSSVTIAHGLYATPNRLNALFASAPPSGAQLYVAPSEADATNFIVRSTAAMTGDTAIFWEAGRGHI